MKYNFHEKEDFLPRKMHNLSIEPGQLTQIKQTQKLVAGMKMANFMSLREDEFACLVNEVENDPLFKKLMYPQDKKEKIIGYQRFPHADLNTNFYELKENITPETTSFDVVSFLEDKKEIIPTIRKIGIERFKEYFLYNENACSNEEISTGCGLTIGEVEKINDFLDELAIHSDFFHPSRITPSEQIRYTKIASFEKDNSGNFLIKYYSPNFARGRYAINYEKIARLKKERSFSKEETKKLDKLLKKLELINLRKSALNQIFHHLLQTQIEYLKSNDWKKIKFLSQKDLASIIGVHPSVVNRMIQYRSVETPSGEEKPLKYFFTGKKREIQNLIRNLLEEEKDELSKGTIARPYSDEEIRNKLKSEYRITVSRRTVREYRNEMKINSTFQRQIRK